MKRGSIFRSTCIFTLIIKYLSTVSNRVTYRTNICKHSREVPKYRTLYITPQAVKLTVQQSTMQYTVGIRLGTYNIVVLTCFRSFCQNHPIPTQPNPTHHTLSGPTPKSSLHTSTILLCPLEPNRKHITFTLNKALPAPESALIGSTLLGEGVMSSLWCASEAPRFRCRRGSF